MIKDIIFVFRKGINAESSVNEMERLIEGMDSIVDAIDDMPDADDLLNVI